MALSTASTSVTSTNRVIALVDMDCFYVQVEERDNPAIKGVPAAVVQYKAYKGGGIIAVNYEARAKGVGRHIRGDDAKAICPEIQLVRVPETRGKADLTKYRDAGMEVINVLTDFSSCVERASVDEAYIDLTEAVEVRLAELSSQESFSSWGKRILESLDMECFSTNYVLGHDSTNSWFDSIKEGEIPSTDDLKLAIGAEIVGKMREAVYQRTSFRCSAGIAHNKVVAKLVCGINKPNKQTILPHSSINTLWSTTKVEKVRGLGGKLGWYLTEKRGCVFMSDLFKFSEKELSAGLGSRTGAWLYQLCLGFDDEPVTARQLAKSIGCNKNFYGPEALKTKEKVKYWITQLATEVTERIIRDLETNNRRAKTLTLHVKFEEQNSLSRSCGIPQYNPERMAVDAFAVMERLYQALGILPVNSLGLIASKFEDEADTSGYAKINEFFKVKSNSTSTSTVTGGSEKSSTSSSASGSDKAASSSLTIKSYFSNSNNPSTSESSGPSSSENSELQKIENPPPKHVDIIDLSSRVTASSSKAVTSEGVLVNKSSWDESESNASEIKPATTTNSSSHPKLSTPIKSSAGVDDPNKPEPQLRKAFFSFSETVPRMSPRKSPRKLVSASTVEASATSTTLTTISVPTEKECERCGKKLSLRDIASHMDYHYAKDLSREINGLPPLNFDLRPETLRKKEASEAADRAARTSQKRPRGSGTSTSASKRGRGAKSVSSTSKVPSRTIDSYFGAKS